MPAEKTTVAAKAAMLSHSPVAMFLRPYGFRIVALPDETVTFERNIGHGITRVTGKVPTLLMEPVEVTCAGACGGAFAPMIFSCVAEMLIQLGLSRVS